MTYLIDGYNLMHAIGLARRNLPAGQLRRSRLQFLDWLADAVNGRDAELQVIFDSVSAAADSPESTHRGVRVRFTRGQTADDEIEAILAAASRPEKVTVVSNDARLRESARRRGARFLSCEEFIDWSLAIRRAPEAKPVPPEVDKPAPVASEAEKAALLEVFSRPPPKRRRR